jgi:hypothetical protein
MGVPPWMDIPCQCDGAETQPGSRGQKNERTGKEKPYPKIHISKENAKANANAEKKRKEAIIMELTGLFRC